MENKLLEVTGVEVRPGATLRFFRPSPAQQLSLFLRHGASVDPAFSDDLLHSFAMNHRIWWMEKPSCTSESETCGCGPVALSDVISLCRDVSEELVQAALRAHRAELSAAWKHFWSGDALSAGGSEIKECCALCIGVGFAHIEDVADEARNLSIEFGEAIAAHPDLFE